MFEMLMIVLNVFDGYIVVGDGYWRQLMVTD